MRRALAFLLALFPLHATWIHVTGPSVDLYTDTSEKTALTVLRRFEALHRVFGESHISTASAPLVIFVFSSAEEYHKYRTITASAAMFQTSDDVDLIALYAGVSMQRTASHEYLHKVIQHASAPLPHWLEEGVPEFYSTLTVTPNKVHIGAPISAYQHLLSTELWLDADDLAQGNRIDGPIFYAESWALVHMLTLSPTWSQGMPQFVKLLNDGREQEEAFTTAFGKPIDQALRELRTYLRLPREITLPAPPPDDATAYQVTPLAPVDAMLALAGLALRTNHLDLAHTLFTRAAKEDPQSPSSAAGLGDLARAENRPQDAERELDRAIALGSRDANAYFQMALLKKDRALLEKTLEIDPHFSEAHFVLGVRETDEGNLASAIAHLRQAVAVQPKRFTYWNALSYAQAKSGDHQGAAESARRAALLASTKQEDQMAAALTLLAQEAPAPPKRKPAVITPPSWQNPKGDTRAEGILTKVDCDSSPVRLVFSTGAPIRTLDLKVQNPTAVELVNADGVSTTLTCGEQSQPVAVDYVAATAEITRIEFKHVIIKP